LQLASIVPPSCDWYVEGIPPKAPEYMSPFPPLAGNAAVSSPYIPPNVLDDRELTGPSEYIGR
jgi:hypothetical protein